MKIKIFASLGEKNLDPNLCTKKKGGSHMIRISFTILGVVQIKTVGATIAIIISIYINYISN